MESSLLVSWRVLLAGFFVVAILPTIGPSTASLLDYKAATKRLCTVIAKPVVIAKRGYDRKLLPVKFLQIKWRVYGKNFVKTAPAENLGAFKWPPFRLNDLALCIFPSEFYFSSNDSSWSLALIRESDNDPWICLLAKLDLPVKASGLGNSKHLPGQPIGGVGLPGVRPYDEQGHDFKQKPRLLEFALQMAKKGAWLIVGFLCSIVGPWEISEVLRQRTTSGGILCGFLGLLLIFAAQFFLSHFLDLVS